MILIGMNCKNQTSPDNLGGLFNRINPAFKAKLKEKNEREVRLTQDQLRELLEKAKEQGRIYTAVLIALLAGLRRNEIISVKWSDIDLERSLISIEPCSMLYLSHYKIAFAYSNLSMLPLQQHALRLACHVLRMAK